MDAYIGNTYHVKISADGQLRANTSLASGAWSDGKNAWVGANVAVADDYLDLGTITITDASTLTYAPVLDINGESANTSLNFYVSISADNVTGTDTKAAGDNYGELSVVSIA